MTEQHNYAGFWRRFLAASIDGAIMVLFGIGLSFTLGVNWFDQNTQQPQQIINNFINFVFSVLYSVYFWVHQEGATPGKKLLAIKIIKTNGNKLDYGTAIVREFAYLVSLVALGLGFFWVIWDKNKQGWHDKIAGTYVVKTDKNPRIFLAITLSALFYMIFFGSALTVGIVEELKTVVIDKLPSESLKLSRDNMSQKAKVHYDKTQELFGQMNAVKDNPEQIKPIADQTIKEAKLAVDIEPNNPFLWSNLGDAYGWPSTLGIAEDSLNAYKKAEELDSNNVVYINFVGDQLIRMERYEEAVLQFQKTFRLTDTSGLAHLSAGKAYKALKVYDQARDHFNKAIEILKAQNKNGQFDHRILDAQKEIGSLPR